MMEYSTALELYDRMVATQAEVERKGATMPYTSLNGHMFSFLAKEGVVGLRLPADEREQFIEQYNTKLCEQYGSIMKEYVQVPDDLLKQTEELASHFEVSYAYVRTLKPK